MLSIIVGRGGASTGLTSRLHCLASVTSLGNPLHKCMELVEIAGVWKFLIFYFAARCLRCCTGSYVMSKYGVLAYVSGGVPTLRSLAGTGRTRMGTGSSVDWS